LVCSGPSVEANSGECDRIGAERAGRFTIGDLRLEIGMLAAKKRIVLQVSVEEYVRTLFQRDGIVEEPVSAEIALLSTTLANFYGDPADRIIVATAMVNSVPVVTRDGPMMRHLKKAKLAECIAC
jgi:PIN domain nuclease of toxin-antitoxin system